MEPIMGAILAGEWSSFNGIYSSEEQFMAAGHHFLAGCGVPNEDQLTIGASSLDDQLASTMWPGTTTTYEGVSPCSNISEIDNSYPYSFSQGIISSTYSHPVTWITSNNSVPLQEECQNENLFLIEADHKHEWSSQETSNGTINGEESGGNQLTAAVDHFPQLKWECDHMTVQEPAMKSRSLSGNSKKRSSSQVEEEPKNKRNVRSRKSQKLALMSDNEEDGSSAGSNKGPSSNSSLSGDQHSNSSHDEELGGRASSLSPKGPAALNLSGKARATRGSATDPQSVYARKRREKINERLRVLQNLVPNGTKVDISTMLEEAVQYVKFLQLQIKLLSSDELWMYAPLAYNGMDMAMGMTLDHLRLAASRQ